jgi:hypothetical protein
VEVVRESEVDGMEAAFMKGTVVLSLLMTSMVLLVGSVFLPSYAQAPANKDAPTFYRLVPGTYVNGWPRFTIHYPKDWVERQPGGTPDVFDASPPGPSVLPGFFVGMWQDAVPLSKWADFWVFFLTSTGATDITVVNNNPSRLKDGTPVYEAGIHIGAMGGSPWDAVSLCTTKGDMFITWGGGHWLKGKTGEDPRPMLYSLQFEAGHDEPVKVPPDVQEFLDSFSSAMVSRDLQKVMAHYSDRYLNSGERKGGREQFKKDEIGPVTSWKMSITEFVPAGDTAYLTGFAAVKREPPIASRFAGPDKSAWGTLPIRDISIIKENGEWKWFGNQRDVVR